MRFFCIGDEDTVLGFNLVGIEGRIVTTESEAKEAFRVALSSKDVGIIIITEKVAQLIRSLVDEYIYKQSFPLIVEVADKSGPIKTRESIKQLVKEAIGVNF